MVAIDLVSNKGENIKVNLSIGVEQIFLLYEDEQIFFLNRIAICSGWVFARNPLHIRAIFYTSIYLYTSSPLFCKSIFCLPLSADLCSIPPPITALLHYAPQPTECRNQVSPSRVSFSFSFIVFECWLLEGAKPKVVSFHSRVAIGRSEFKANDILFALRYLMLRKDLRAIRRGMRLVGLSKVSGEKMTPTEGGAY